MKKYFIIFLSLMLFIFVGCTKTSALPKFDVDNAVALELEKMDNGLSDETLKAMSVVLRTNFKIDQIKPDENQKPTEKYLSIAKQTKNKVLRNKNNSLIKISFEKPEEYTWQKTIKKSQILEFALKNNINLTNLSTIEPIKENEKVIGLKIGNKYFEYEDLANHFGLESNLIENITENKKEIVIKGKNNNLKNYFDIKKSEQLSNDNHNYYDILTIFFDDLFLD